MTDLNTTDLNPHDPNPYPYNNNSAAPLADVFAHLVDQNSDSVRQGVHERHGVVNDRWRTVLNYWDIASPHSFTVELCIRCCYMHVACRHTGCQWDDDRQVLWCPLCGEDLS